MVSAVVEKIVRDRYGVLLKISNPFYQQKIRCKKIRVNGDVYDYVPVSPGDALEFWRFLSIPVDAVVNLGDVVDPIII